MRSAGNRRGGSNPSLSVTTPARGSAPLNPRGPELLVKKRQATSVVLLHLTHHVIGYVEVRGDALDIIVVIECFHQA